MSTIKYILLGGASSSILVHGFSWLYGLSRGEIELQEILNALISTRMCGEFMNLTCKIVTPKIGLRFFCVGDLLLTNLRW